MICIVHAVLLIHPVNRQCGQRCRLVWVTVYRGRSDHSKIWKSNFPKQSMQMHGELSTVGLSLQIDVYECGQLYRANRKIHAQTCRLAIQSNRIMNRKLIYTLIYDIPVKIVKRYRCRAWPSLSRFSWTEP